MSLLDSKVLDGFFIDFYSFAMQPKAEKMLDWEMAHKVRQTVGRLDKLLKGKDLGAGKNHRRRTCLLPPSTRPGQQIL